MQKKTRLRSIRDCPTYLTAHNEFIFEGYRVNYSIADCSKSIFSLHNETWNIWTHLLGFLLFVVLSIVTPLMFMKSSSSLDKFVVMVFLIAAQIQMLFSTLFHIFNCNSPKTYDWCAKLDNVGISIMIVGSYYPPMYYGFKCYGTLQILYIALITVFGAVGICLGCIPTFSSSRFRVIRTGFFLMFGFFAVFPVPHMALLVGFKTIWPVIWRESIMGLCYTLGAIIYVTRIPEKILPGQFDLSWAASHVIWHYFTIAAALVSYGTTLHLYFHRNDYVCV